MEHAELVAQWVAHDPEVKAALLLVVIAGRAEDGVPLDAWGRPEDDQAVIIVTSWAYVGAGYATEGERWLALSAAARAREQRRVAWDELRTTAA
jgi:hypothetical protein